MNGLAAASSGPRSESRFGSALLDAWRSLTPLHWRWTSGLATFFTISSTVLILLVIESAAHWQAVLLKSLLSEFPTAVFALLGVAVVERNDRGTRPPVGQYVAVVFTASAFGGLLSFPAHLLSIRAAAAFNWPATPLPFNPSTIVPLWWAETVWWLFTLGGTVFTYVYLRNHSRTARALAAAEARSTEARRQLLANNLAATQALADPAFLFDALRLIEERYERDAAGGDRLMEALIAYLRAALPMLDEAPPTLGRQADLARAFLEIERERAGVPLQFEVAVPAELAETPLPPLLLLPLLDNAVRHAIAPVARGGHIEVRAHASGDRLFISIVDDGPGRVTAIVEGGGLRALRERINGLFGSRGRLQLLDNLHGGITARIEVPHEASPRGRR